MSNQQQNHALSEVFPLTVTQSNITGFRLTPSVDKELGNRLSFRFSQQFTGIIVIWNQGTFLVLSEINLKLSSQKEWKQALTKNQTIDDFKRSYWSFKWVSEPEVNSELIGKLAYQILTIHRPFNSVEVYKEKKVTIKREIDFWSEMIELKDEVKARLTLTIKSPINFKGTLADFFDNHPERQDPDKVLIGFKVKSIDFYFNSSGKIVRLAGTIGEHQKRLIEMAAGSISKQALKNSPKEQPLVSVKFSSNKEYPYAMAALTPIITAETAPMLNLDYGKLLKHTNIKNFTDRQNLLKDAQEKADILLSKYGITIEKRVLPNLVCKIK